MPQRAPWQMAQTSQWNPDGCTGSLATCFQIASTERMVRMACSVCQYEPIPGTIKAVKFENGVTTRHYDFFCGDCFRSSRPLSWWCRCPDNLLWYMEHRRQKGLLPVGYATPPGPPKEPPPPQPQPPPGLSTDTAVQTWTPPAFLPQPTPNLQQQSSFSSAAPSVSSPFGDHANMVQVLERMQTDMADMKQKMAVLKSPAGALQISQQPLRAPPERNSL